MIKSAFSDVIRDPAKLNQLAVNDLRDVIREFPYFPAAHVLLAKKLKEEDSVSFEKQLNLTAAYVPSRKVLYKLIHESAQSPEYELNVDHSLEEAVLPEVPQAEIDKREADPLDLLIKTESESIYRLEDLAETPAPEMDLPKPFETGNQTLNFGGWLEYFEGHKPEKLKSEKEIIDEFIRESPRIEPLPMNLPPAENLAKPSFQDLDDEFVTETLAKIHLDQGNRMKSIEIYERLKLKYPEKSAYFAAQIEFLKQK